MSRHFGISPRVGPYPHIDRVTWRMRGRWWSYPAALLALLLVLWGVAGCAAAPAPQSYEPGLTIWCLAHPHRGTCP